MIVTHGVISPDKTSQIFKDRGKIKSAMVHPWYMEYSGFRIKNEGVLLVLTWRDFQDTLTSSEKKKSKSQNQSPTRYFHFMEKVYDSM